MLIFISNKMIFFHVSQYFSSILNRSILFYLYRGRLRGHIHLFRRSWQEGVSPLQAVEPDHVGGRRSTNYPWKLSN